MNKVLVTVFDSEDKAYRGLEALRDLHADGDITVNASAVISKNDQGEIEIKERKDNSYLGTTVGIVIGAIVGIIGGPQGVAFGAAMGLGGGALYDLDRSGVDADYVREVAAAMKNGTVAIIADVEESWTVPVDSRMEEVGGTVYRKNRYRIEEDYLQRQSKEYAAEVTELHEEMKEAEGVAKNSLQEQMDRAKDKQEKLKSAINLKKETLRKEWAEKKEILDKQLAMAKEQNKSKLEKRKAGLQSDFERRQKQLDGLAHEMAGYIL